MRSSKRYKSQSGIALVLFVVTAVVLLGMIGYAVDTYLMTVTKTQYQAAADAASLSALERFYDEYDPAATGDPRQYAIDQAILSARDTLKRQVGFLITSNYLSDKTKAQDDLKLPGVSSENGNVIPGYWITDKNQPMVVDTTKTPPYFLEYDPAKSFVPSAFRVVINLNANSPVKTTLMKLIGVDSYTVGAQATAVTTARKGVFLMDLSPSITESSHDYKNLNLPPSLLPLCPRAQKFYSYPIDGACSIGAPVVGNKIYDIPLTNLDPQNNPRSVFNCMDPVDQAKYRCVKVESPNDIYYDINQKQMKSSFEGYLAVDMETAPQPLSDILTGIHYALKQFSKRDVGGDRIGIFGFDDRNVQIPTGGLAKADGFLSVRSTLDPSGEPGLVTSRSDEFYKMLCATRCPVPNGAGPNCTYTHPAHCPTAAGFGAAPSHLERFLFPQYFSNNPPASGDIPDYLSTNIRIAIQQAAELLKAQPDFETSENFIAIFTDGKSNCKAVGFNPLGQIKYDCDPGRLSYHIDAIKQVIDQAVNDLAPYINLHIFLAGDTVGPHTILRKGFEGQCLDDITARQLTQSIPANAANYYFVNEGSGYDKIINMPEPFLFPNVLYKAALATGGLWLPLRPPCMPGVNLLKATTGVTNSGRMTLACANTSGLVGTLLKNNNPGLQFGNLPSQMDSAGRLFCDPEGRNIGEQINLFVDTIMGVNPIRLQAEPKTIP